MYFRECDSGVRTIGVQKRRVVCLARQRSINQQAEPQRSRTEWVRLTHGGEPRLSDEDERPVPPRLPPGWCDTLEAPRPRAVKQDVCSFPCT